MCFGNNTNNNDDNNNSKNDHAEYVFVFGFVYYLKLTHLNVLEPQCPTPPLPNNAFIIQSTSPSLQGPFSAADVITLACQDGYVPTGRLGSVNGSVQITCLQNGTWSPSRPSDLFQCVLGAVPCPSPDLPQFSTTIKDSKTSASAGTYNEGDFVQYSCQPGYTIYGTIQCRGDGKWSSASMTCQPQSRNTLPANPVGPFANTCQPPPPPSNAAPISSSAQYFTGEYVQYRCNTGYVNSGVTTCLRDGTWSAAVFICEQGSGIVTLPPPGPVTTNFPFITRPPVSTETCPEPAVPRNSRTVAQYLPPDGSKIFPVGAFFIFQCNDGFRMVGDQIIICNLNGQWTASPTCV